MVKFLHVADVHLGFDRYNNSERTLDFYDAFRDALQRYAIEDPVDFVLIAGDLFEYKTLTPGVLNQAIAALRPLRQAGIPVLAIEGNHDHQPYGSHSSWLRYLSDWEWLQLLEPETGDNPLQPWDPEERRGAYLDLSCGVRVIGSRWYGSATPQALRHLATQIGQLPPSPGPTVMLVHHGIEGQIARYAGALRYEDVLPLRQAGVDYLALGHIHKHYSIENWIFNPGSVEANSVAENLTQNPRGVLRVEIENGRIQAELKQAYQQRPILRLKLNLHKAWSIAELEAAARQLIKTAAQQQQTQAAIVELRLCGSVGFNRLDLNVSQLETELREIAEPLILLLRPELQDSHYESPLPQTDQLTLADIEASVFEDALAADNRYADRSTELARGLTDLKQRLLQGEADTEIYGFLEPFLSQYY
jgi:DNA repair exonuclease SbcCD nuclease subunit